MKKYLQLKEYEQWLEVSGYSDSIKTAYMTRLVKMEKAGLTDSSTAMEAEEIINTLGKTKNVRNQYMAALVSYQRHIIKHNILDGVCAARMRLQNQYDGDIVEPVLTFQTYKNAINNCEEENVKLALTLMLEGGFRSSDVATLTKESFTLRNGKAWVKVVEPKTGKTRHVRLPDNKKLYETLVNLPDDFHMPTAIQIRDFFDGRRGKSHDLRRYYARRTYAHFRKEMGKKDALEATRQKMGHSVVSVTQRYVGNLYVNDRGKRLKEDWRRPYAQKKDSKNK